MITKVGRTFPSAAATCCYPTRSVSIIVEGFNDITGVVV
jgi:hypothetical protein